MEPVTWARPPSIRDRTDGLLILNRVSLSLLFSITFNFIPFYSMSFRVEGKFHYFILEYVSICLIRVDKEKRKKFTRLLRVRYRL